MLLSLAVMRVKCTRVLDVSEKPKKMKKKTRKKKKKKTRKNHKHTKTPHTLRNKKGNKIKTSTCALPIIIKSI
jgi:hypothetical protein